MEIFTLLIWSFVFAAISALVANTKGLSSGKWFAISFILGPIGFVWVLLTAKDEVAIAKRKIEDGDLKACPFCAEAIKEEALICKHCGRDQPVVDEEQRRARWVCPHCKAIGKGTQKACRVCNRPRPTPVQ